MPVKNAIKPLLVSILLNFVVFSTVIIGFASIFTPETALFTGFILIAAAPPGPSVIPFSASMKGDIHFSITGVFGTHLAAIFLTPAILYLFLGKSLIPPAKIFGMMTLLIIIPLVISRFLRHKKIQPIVEKYRGRVINWGFFFVIMPIIGLSRDNFIHQPGLLLHVSLVCFAAMFVLGFVYVIFLNYFKSGWGFTVSSTLMLVTKNSAFSSVAALTFFGEKAAFPSAVLGVFVTLFIITFGSIMRWKWKKYLP